MRHAHNAVQAVLRSPVMADLAAHDGDDGVKLARGNGIEPINQLDSAGEVIIGCLSRNRSRNSKTVEFREI